MQHHPCHLWPVLVQAKTAMANVLNTASYGNSGQLQFMDDGSFIFRPKQGASITGVEVAGFLQLDQQSAPSVSPSGTTRLYFDTSQQQILQSIGGGSYTTLATTQLSNGGGTITISAAGAITETPATGQATTINGGGAGTNQLLIAGDGTVTLQSSASKSLTLNGPSSSSIAISTTGAITLTVAAATSFTIAGASSSQIQIGGAGNISLTPTANGIITTTGLVIGANNGAAVLGSKDGYWILPGGPGTSVVAAPVSASVAANNDVRVLKIFIPTTLSITKISLEVTTLSGGTHVAIGLYTTDGNTKVLDSGAMSSAATGIVTSTISATQVPAGFYYFAFTSDSTVPILEGVTVEPTTGVTIGIINNGGVVQMGKATNVSAAGVLPATLGALSAVNTSNGAQWPFVVIN